MDDVIEIVQGDNDVFSIEETTRIQNPPAMTYETDHFLLLMRNEVARQFRNQEDRIKWFASGIECRLLKRGQPNWIPGKIRVKVSLVFIPNEAEKPSEADEPTEPQE